MIFLYKFWWGSDRGPASGQNSVVLQLAVYAPGLRSLTLTPLLTRNKPTRSSIFSLNYPSSLSVSLTGIEYTSETFSSVVSDAMGEMTFESHGIGVRVFA